MRCLLFFTLVQFSLFAQCDTVAPLNKAIVAFAKAHLKKKVGTGECWDLAKFALDEVGAEWNGEYVYGRKITSACCVLPGDIIQFEKVKIKYKKGKDSFSETMPHHTAIVYEKINDDEIVLIHQNTGYSGKKVGTSSLRFSTIYAGKYTIYRPEK